MKTYVIVGGPNEGIYTKPWSDVQPLVQTKPAPKYKGFTSQTDAKAWFDEQKNTLSHPAHSYEIAYDGKFNKQDGHLYIFTDGGNRNTGNVKGGHVQADDLAAWAVAAFNGRNSKAIFTASEAYRGRTNNDMEITALLNALQWAEQQTGAFTIISDSKYVLDTTTNWMYNWQRNGWKKSSGDIANLELWQAVYEAIQQVKDRISFIWVKGHATSIENIMVDELLNQAMDQL